MTRKMLCWLFDDGDDDAFPEYQHPYVEDDDERSPDFGYCAKCGMEKYAADLRSVKVHINAKTANDAIVIDLEDWQSWRDANMPGGE